jgi:type II secretory pathway pseudopilin PulG
VSPRTSRGRGTGDRGTSLVEILVATTVMAAVIATVFSLVDSGLRREQSEEEVSAADRTVAVAVDLFAADVRHARALVVPATGEDPTQVITLDVTEPDGRQLRIRWRTTATTVLRQQLDLLGAVSVSQTVLTNAQPAAPTFAYYNATGIELQPGVTTPGALAGCAAQLGIDLRMDPSTGRRQVARHVVVAVPSIGRGEVAAC